MSKLNLQRGDLRFSLYRIKVESEKVGTDGVPTFSLCEAVEPSQSEKVSLKVGQNYSMGWIAAGLQLTRMLRAEKLQITQN